MGFRNLHCGSPVCICSNRTRFRNANYGNRKKRLKNGMRYVIMERSGLYFLKFGNFCVELAVSGNVKGDLFIWKYGYYIIFW